MRSMKYFFKNTVGGSLVILLLLSSMTIGAVAASQNLFTELFIGDDGSYNTMTYEGTEERTWNHYEVSSYWSNGYVRTVSNWVVDSQGVRRTKTYISSFPETGKGSMGPYGTPGGFAGCHCPNCIGLY